PREQSRVYANRMEVERPLRFVFEMAEKRRIVWCNLLTIHELSTRYNCDAVTSRPGADRCPHEAEARLGIVVRKDHRIYLSADVPETVISIRRKAAAWSDEVFSAIPATDLVHCVRRDAVAIV